MSSHVETEDGFFRGSELVRLMVLAGVLAAGLPALYLFFQQKDQPPPARARTLEDIKPIPPRDNHPSFKGVEDEERVRIHDTPAYAYLLKKVRGESVEALAKESSREVLFAHIWKNPDRYRGVPIHLEGVADFVGVNQEVAFAKDQRLYEVWIRTSESAPEHYCCVFEDAPPKFPAGPILREDVTFDGYFLKIMAYRARDLANENDPKAKAAQVQLRGVPLLVGRLTWKPQESRAPSGLLTSSYLWMFALIGALLVYSVIRLIFQSRSFASVVSAIPKVQRTSAPNDQISPQELSEWANQMARDDDDDGDADADPHSGEDRKERQRPQSL